jgi:long-chain acyl-CoA synthetase
MNLAQLIDRHPDGAAALVEPGRSVSFGELRTLVAATRGGLVSKGARAGDRIGLIGPNCVDLVVAYLAILGVGAVAVPLNRNNPSAATASELAAVDASFVVGCAGFAARDRWRTATVAELSSAAPSPVADRLESDLAALLFTSGTAGAPKAAMLTHGSLRANIEQASRVDDWLRSDDVVLGVLPLDHIFGLNVVVGQSLAVGASVVLVPQFDPAGTLATIVAERVTVVPGVPAMYVAWNAMAEADRHAFANVRMALSGASKLGEALSRSFNERAGVVIREGYGLTEASPVVTTSMFGAPKVGSIGRVLDGITVRLVDDDGDDVLAGDAGEIWVKGPNVFAGYWRDADATARALTADGWLRTGDVAVIDDSGNLYLVDRAKDLIIVSGFNVYPAEVEDVLSSHPAVAEVAVIGTPHPTTGETVKAFVALRPSATVTSGALTEHCRDQLARYKCPTVIDFVEELPRGTNGKVLRRILR